MKYDVAIIGAGLGGLQTAYILAKNGLKVCVLEKNHLVGGCLQTFKRGKNEFDTGFHYVGGLDDGQPLNTIFSYFNLMHLPWHRLDSNAFDEVYVGNKSFFFANGYDNFVEALSQQFPHQKQNLVNYVALLKQVGDGLKNSFLPRAEADVFGTSLFTRSAYDFLCQTITDPLLRNVLSGTSLKMELAKSTLPLYIFAQINSTFIQSAWRLNGGGQLIADSLVESIKSMGGTVIVDAEVTEMVEKDGRLSALVVGGCDESIEADWFVSSLHPMATLNLLKESQVVRKIYRRRISNLQNTFGMFTVNIALKEGQLPYLNRNQFIYNTNDVWSIAEKENCGQTQGVLVSYRVPHEGNMATNIDILTPMQWQEVEQWAETQVGRRGDDYKQFKEQKAQECIALASRVLPQLPSAVDKVFTSSPLTYYNYTATQQGAAYGIRKDYNNPMQTLLTPRTPLPNLLLTGQNLNLHGILGVSMSSFFTAAEIIGMECATKELKFS